MLNILSSFTSTVRKSYISYSIDIFQFSIRVSDISNTAITAPITINHNISSKSSFPASSL